MFSFLDSNPITFKRDAILYPQCLTGFYPRRAVYRYIVPALRLGTLLA